MTAKVTIDSLFHGDGVTPLRAYVIAEIGINHEGNVDLCAEMIRNFSKVGADAIKLQTVDAKRSYAPDSQSYDIFSRSALTPAQTANMFELARECGVEVFTTSGDMQTLAWVDKLKPVAHKISSGLLSCLPIVDDTCRLGRPVLISTGMSDDTAISKTVEIAKLHDCKLALFQCTSEYPCPTDKLNLAAIHALHQKYSLPVGFSDHSQGFSAAPLAVAAGARMIEKHVTFEQGRTGFDHPISLTDDEFAVMVQAIRHAETAMGHADKQMDEALRGQARRFERRLAALKDFDAGHVLAASDLLFIRFATEIDAIPAHETEKAVGKTLKVKLSAGQGISWQDLL